VANKSLGWEFSEKNVMSAWWTLPETDCEFTPKRFMGMEDDHGFRFGLTAKFLAGECAV